MNKKNMTITIVAIILVVAIIAVLYFTVFSKSGTSGKKLEGSLEEIMSQMYSSVKEELPKLSNTVVTQENLPYYLGVEKLDYKEALASEPFIGSIPYSVVLVRVNEGVDIEKTKADIKAKINPRKWICVAVEESNIIVDNIGDVIILIMDNEAPTSIQKSFKALAK